MRSYLPNLKSLQALEAFGRLGSVRAAAQELCVTPSAVSQQIKQLEEQLEITLILKDGRRATLAPEATAYFQLVTEGFEKLRLAQRNLSQERSGAGLTISSHPTLLLKWLNPRLHKFQAIGGGQAIRLDATPAEPDPQALGRMFRLTYGAVAKLYPHSRELFTDICFPVCSPDFLARHPQATDPNVLVTLPLVEIDWGPAYRTLPKWSDWFRSRGINTEEIKPVMVHSLSGLALEAAINGQGAVLAQDAFSSLDIELGRLVRLSPDSLDMPEPYYICWGNETLQHSGTRGFLNWVVAESESLNDQNIV